MATKTLHSPPESLMDKVNLAQKFSLFSDQCSPKIVGEVNDAYVKLVKLQGDFMWHHHDKEDELFFVVKGALRIRVRENGAESEFIVSPGEFIIIPRGVEHFPSADEETHIMLLEPKSTLNTGNVQNARTVHELQNI
jgi:mannose-6-phosphate isomerase-like protein (cupin superfamily)